MGSPVSRRVTSARALSPAGQLGLATSIAALRLFALSAVLSVLTPYGLELGGSLEAVGFAFAAYALAAVIFQVPFGILADRHGAKGALVLGMVLTAAGSLVAAVSTDIWILAAGRFLAGAGAVNGVAAAIAADAFPEARRTRMLALFGAAVGAAFTLGLIAGPLLAPLIGVPGLFVLQAAFAVVALGVVLRAPFPSATAESADRARPSLGGLAGLHAAGFATNFALSVTLFAYPLAMLRFLDPATAQRILPVAIILGGLVMFLGARTADKGRLRVVIGLAVTGLAAGPVLLLHGPILASALVGTWLLFAAQSTLAAALPSAVARLTRHRRAAAQSMLSLAQSAGTAAGGVVAGVLYAREPGLAAAVAAVALVAAVLSWRALR